MVSQFCPTVTIYNSPGKVQGPNITTDKGSIDFYFLEELDYASSVVEGEPMSKLLKLREGIAVLNDDGNTFSKKQCFVAINYEGAGTKPYSGTGNRHLTLHGDKESLVNMLATAALTPRYAHKRATIHSSDPIFHIVADLRQITKFAKKAAAHADITPER